jgi:hypothetical protein
VLQITTGIRNLLQLKGVDEELIHNFSRKPEGKISLGISRHRGKYKNKIHHMETGNVIMG